MRKVIFLTCGELPVLNTLFVSQVAELANATKRCEIECELIVFAPRFAHFKYYLKNRKSAIHEYKQFCEKNGIKLTLFYTWIQVFGRLTLLFKNFLTSNSAKKLTSYLKNQPTDVVLNCRSYYATDVALKARRLLLNHNVSCKVVFDMRSILSLELAMQWKFIGPKIFGYAKIWENRLINESTVSLAVTQRSVDFLSKEHGVSNRIKKIPIGGFQKRKLPDNIFDLRWAKRKVIYLGNVGAWNDIESITRMFDYLERHLGPLEKYIVTESSVKACPPSCSILSLQRDELENFCADSLAFIHPGRVSRKLDFFLTCKLSINSFSTKVAESLSLGIPIVSNTCFQDLSNFLNENQCGLDLTWDRRTKSFFSETQSDHMISSKEYWKRLTNSAFEMQNHYTMNATIDAYKSIWNSL